MISGCGPGSVEAVDLALVPVPIDLASTRCVRPDEATRREATLTVQAPKPDITDVDGQRAVTRAALKEKVDEARAAIARKNGALQRVISESDRCIDGATPPAEQSHPESNRVS